MKRRVEGVKEWVVVVKSGPPGGREEKEPPRLLPT